MVKGMGRVCGREVQVPMGRKIYLSKNDRMIVLPDAALGRTVIRLSCIGFTLPKSAILICPSAVSSKFSGCNT